EMRSAAGRKPGGGVLSRSLKDTPKRNPGQEEESHAKPQRRKEKKRFKSINLVLLCGFAAWRETSCFVFRVSTFRIPLFRHSHGRCPNACAGVHLDREAAPGGAGDAGVGRGPGLAAAQWHRT